MTCMYVKYFTLCPAVVDCGTPPTVTHGFTTLSRGTELGSVATYSCESQYVLAGSSTRECAEDSEWSGQSPVCKRMLSWYTGIQCVC